MFVLGDRVRHYAIENGTVIKVFGFWITVRFDSGKEKVLHQGFLEKI